MKLLNDKNGCCNLLTHYTIGVWYLSGTALMSCVQLVESNVTTIVHTAKINIFSIKIKTQITSKIMSVKYMIRNKWSTYVIMTLVMVKVFLGLGLVPTIRFFKKKNCQLIVRLRSIATLFLIFRIIDSPVIWLVWNRIMWTHYPWECQEHWKNFLFRQYQAF